MTKDEAIKLALEALEQERDNYQDWDKEDGAPEYIYEAITALREALAEQPAQQQPWADECRIELVNAVHFLASDFENALGAFGGDTEARRKAKGDIVHARSIASRWNWNGTSPQAQRTWVGLTDEDVRQCSRDVVAGGKENSVDRFAYAIEAKLKEKNT